MRGSLRLGKIVGIDVYAHISLFIVLSLLTWSLASSWLVQVFPGWSASTYWVVALISALLLFTCVLLHELAHALVARVRGLTVSNITLFIIGGVSNIEEETRRPGVEFQVAAAGPLASLLLAALAFLLGMPVRGSGSPTEAVLDYLAISNALLGNFNLLPGFPLDGGHILRSITWALTGSLRQATHTASSIGQAIGYLVILLGITWLFAVNFFNGLLAIIIGWFLLKAAQAAGKQARLQSMLQGVTAGQVMNPLPAAAPANISVRRLVDEYFLVMGLRSVPVVQGEYFAGLIELTDITRLGRERWTNTPVGHVMRLPEQIPVATPEQPLYDVLQVMMTQHIDKVPVVHDGHLIGLVGRETIVACLLVRQGLKVDGPRPAA